MSETTRSSTHELGNVIRLFLRLGFTAFGGPAAHIAMMHDEVVTRRKWLSEQEFLDLLGATNLIPGPNSTEMVIHVGYKQAGWRGLVAAGVCFILPAMLIVFVLAWAYQQYGSTAQAEWLLYGVKPVIIAVIVQALWTLSLKAVKDWLTGIIGVLALGLYLLNFNEIALLFSAGIIVLAVRYLTRKKSPLSPPESSPPEEAAPEPKHKNWAFLPLLGIGALAQQSYSLAVLFFTFLKIGSVLYGGGYVLLAFLRSDFVERLGWLTDQQLIDAVAVGQVTPGPLFTTATFIGYQLGGIIGGLLATAGIFLPAFVFVAITYPFIPRLRNSIWAGAVLDGVNVASLGLMAGVTLHLGMASLIDPLTILLAFVATVLILRYKINTTYLVLGGAVVGLLRAWLG